jgi:hypothetical protein
MSVEMNYYYEDRTTGRLDYYDSHVIPPGGYERVALEGRKERILVVCQDDDKNGSVLIRSSKKNMEAQKYEDMEKIESQKMKLGSKNIKIAGKQGVVISIKEKDKYLDMKIYVSHNFRSNQPSEQILAAS